MRDASARQVKLLGCAGHTHAVLKDRRYLRWRCKHHQCAEAVEAKRKGLHCFHVLDLDTDREWTEFEDMEAKAA